MDGGNSLGNACPVYRQPVSVLIKAVQYELGALEKRLQVAFFYKGVYNLHLQVRIEAEQTLRCQMGLGSTQIRRAEEDLAVEIARLHTVAVHQHQASDACCGEVKGGRSAHTAQTEHGNLTIVQLLLTHPSQAW